MDAEPVIPSGTDTEEVSGEAEERHPRNRKTREKKGRAAGSAGPRWRSTGETYLTVPKIRNRKTVFVSEDVRDELDAVVRQARRAWHDSGLLENLAREHLAAYRGDIEQWRKI